MPKVELHSAFIWDCDSCGRENTHRAIHGDLEDPAFKKADSNGLDISARDISGDWDQVGFEVRETGDGASNEPRYEYRSTKTHICLAPRMVKCGACGAVFRTIVSGTFCDPDIDEEPDEWEFEGQD